MSEPSIPPPKKNHLWIIFFAFLLIASVSVTVIMIKFNLSIQLTQGQLDEAWELWKAKGIKNYNLVYTKQINDGQPITFAVMVRSEKVVDVRMNGQHLKKEQLPYHSMDRLFHDSERFLTMDQKEGAKKVYAIARFDPHTGAMLYYVRNVVGEHERVEINVKLEVVG